MIFNCGSKFQSAHLATLLGAIVACVAITFAESPAQGYTFFDTPTAWNPGPNTARIGGYPAPGGATWSIMAPGVADSASFDHPPAGGGNTFTTDLSALYVGGIDEVTAIGLALDQWAAVSGFTNLGQVSDGGGSFAASGPSGEVGDIRIGAIYIDGNTGINDFAHAFQPATSAFFATGSIGGDVHFDNANTWSASGGSGTIDFYTIALHELGHALGLGHSDVVGSVMEATYTGQRRTLHADDIAGIQAIYGPPVPEPRSLVLLITGGLILAAYARGRRPH